MATQAQLAAVQQLYVGYLGRAADSAGQQFWANAIANGTATIASVATGFTLSAEYKAAYGGLTTDALVEKVYNNVLGRTPDAEGKAFWVAALANGKVTADTLVATIVTNLGALDQQTINNKVFVAQTYTDTVGDAYAPAGGAAVLVGVDSTVASVNAALANIAAGTVAGQVPGSTQIAAVVAAQAEITALEKAIAASNPTFDGDEDGSVTEAEAKAAQGDAEDARDDVSLSTTADLKTAVTTANTNLTKAQALVTASGPAAVAAQKAYDNAVAAQKVLVGDTQATATLSASVVAENNAIAATNTAITAVDTALKSTATNLATTYDKLSTAYGAAITGASTLEAALKSADSAQKTALVAELVKLPSYGQAAVDAVAKEKAIVAANDAVDTAASSTAFGSTGYVSAAQNAVSAADTLAKATVADEAVTAAKAVVAQYTAADDKLTLAETALNTYKTANADKVEIHTDLADQGAAAVDSLTAKSDVFYFSNVDKTTTNDFTIGASTSAATKFGAGDSIVLATGLTYNSGALTTGDNNKAEFFLVQKGSDTLVVIETAAYGSSTTTHAASATDTAPVVSPDAAVITLTGVSVADLTVSNGVISHVA